MKITLFDRDIKDEDLSRRESFNVSYDTEKDEFSVGAMISRFISIDSTTIKLSFDEAMKLKNNIEKIIKEYRQNNTYEKTKDMLNIAKKVQEEMEIDND